MASLTEKIPVGFDKLSREEQERILVDRVGMPPHMARERAAMIRGEIEGDATIETVRTEAGADSSDRSGT